MIVCSCNIVCHNKIRQFLKFRDPFKEKKPSVGTVIRGMGCNAVCGTCSSSIKQEIDLYYGEKE